MSREGDSDVEGALKMTDMKMTDRHNCKAWSCRTWNGRTNCMAWNCKTWHKLIAFYSILVFFLYCDTNVAAMELCNVTMKWIENTCRSNDIYTWQVCEWSYL